MSTTQPIRNKVQLEDFKNYYLKIDKNIRNYTLIVIGLYTALRINDILHLTYNMVYCNDQVRDYIVVRERKTGKENRVLLNKHVKRALEKYKTQLKQTRPNHTKNAYLFPSPKKKDAPLSRYQAYRIVRKAAKEAKINENISCHSLRKTFGYHAWKQGKDHVVLMHIYNHSSFEITKRYLCIDQDEKDNIYRDLQI